MFTLKDVLEVSNKLNIKFDKFTKEELLTGMNIELEHGTINPETNVTNDNLILTTKIALAHLNEFPNYYNSRYGLTMFEKFLKEKMNEKYGVLSGIVEPLGAVVTILLTSLITPILPYILAFAAGAMIYVVVEELIPEAQAGEHSNIGTVGVALGFALMMLLDVALG